VQHLKHVIDADPVPFTSFRAQANRGQLLTAFRNWAHGDEQGRQEPKFRATAIKHGERNGQPVFGGNNWTTRDTTQSYRNAV
jgi:hypothetical protein